MSLNFSHFRPRVQPDFAQSCRRALVWVQYGTVPVVRVQYSTVQGMMDKYSSGWLGDSEGCSLQSLGQNFDTPKARGR